MSEYKHTISKTQPSGFSESPDQTTGNAGSPLLNEDLTAKSAIVMGAVAVQAKKVVSTAYQAVSGQLGSSRLEEQTNAMGKVAMFSGLAYVSGNLALPGLVAVGEVLSFGINNLVRNHALNLENQRLRATTGVRVTYNAGGYYG